MQYSNKILDKSYLKFNFYQLSWITITLQEHLSHVVKLIYNKLPGQKWSALFVNVSWNGRLLVEIVGNQGYGLTFSTESCHVIYDFTGMSRMSNDIKEECLECLMMSQECLECQMTSQKYLQCLMTSNKNVTS